MTGHQNEIQGLSRSRVFPLSMVSSSGLTIQSNGKGNKYLEGFRGSRKCLMN